MTTLGLPNLQGAYEASGAAPHITPNAAGGAVQIRDNAAPLGDIFELADNNGVRHLAGSVLSDSSGGLNHLPDGITRTVAPVQTYAIQWDSLVISDVPGGAPFGNDTAPAMVGSIGECRFDDPGNLFSSALLFNQATIMTANGVNVGPAYTMVNQPLVRTGTLGGSRSFSQANAVRSQMRVGPNLAGNVTLTSHEPFFATITVDATVGTATCTTVNYFAPKAPTLTAGGTIGTLNVLDIPAIAAAGITNLRGINSAMSAGDFILHTGTAPARLGGSLFLGAGATYDVELSRGAANRLDLASGDSLRIVSGALQWVSAAGQINSTVAGELEVTSTRLGFGIAPAGANWAFGFNAAARTITVGGDFANCLNTAGGNHTIDAALTTFTQWTVNAPAGALGTGSVTDAANMIIQTAPGVGTNRYGLLITSNPSGGTLNYAFRQSNASALARFDGRLDINRGIALGGGAAATLGTIGGSGPTAAGQAQWLEIDINGVAHWIPVWT